MRKLIFLLDIGILICIVIFITWSLRLFSEQNSMTLNNNIKYLVEQSYFEGQRDALSGDIRIKKYLIVVGHGRNLVGTAEPQLLLIQLIKNK